MAWTTPPTWVSLELVTAADLNTYLTDNLTYLENHGRAQNTDQRTYTNTTYADLDALTGGAGTIAAVAVTVTTGTKALVYLGAAVLLTSASTAAMSYRVSGASTIAASDNAALRNANTSSIGATAVIYENGLTAGSNTFELQAKVIAAATGTLGGPRLAVVALPGA